MGLERGIVDNLKYDGSWNEKVTYLKDYNIMTKKNGDPFVRGIITDGKEDIALLVWNDAVVDLLKNHNYRGEIIVLSGNYSEYEGAGQFTANNISLYSGLDFVLKDFLPTKINEDKLMEEFEKTLYDNLSINGFKVYNLVFNEDVKKRFKEEFAGTKIHDATLSGLLNHTNKMLNLGVVVLENDERIEEFIPNAKDLLLLGIAFHDVGKIYEYDFGTRRRNSYVSHRAIGIEMLYEVKEEIVEIYDEDFYYQLVAVIQGHHGEFGEREQTVITRIVHLIDMLESHTTMMFDNIEKGDITNEEHIKVRGLVVK